MAPFFLGNDIEKVHIYTISTIHSVSVAVWPRGYIQDPISKVPRFESCERNIFFLFFMSVVLVFLLAFLFGSSMLFCLFVCLIFAYGHSKQIWSLLLPDLYH